MKTTLKKFLFTITLFLCAVNYVQAQDRRDNHPDDRQHPIPPSYKELLQKMDANDDGKLAKNEVKGPLSRDFKHLDANEDGFITESELENGKPNCKRRRPTNENSMNITSVFKEMDANKDKKIAKSEAKNSIAKRFEEFDLDNNGYLSKIEMGKALKIINKGN